MSKEIGITNLGDVPAGMTFAEAVAQAKPKRKYKINPYEGGHRLTLCDTLRMIWREMDKYPDSPEKELIKDYLDAAFDSGKRMDQRMKDLKDLLDKNSIKYEKGK